MASWPDSIRCHPHLMGSTPLHQTGLPACLCPSSDQEQLQLTVSTDRMGPPPTSTKNLIATRQRHGEPCPTHMPSTMYMGRWAGIPPVSRTLSVPSPSHGHIPRMHRPRLLPPHPRSRGLLLSHRRPRCPGTEIRQENLSPAKATYVPSSA